MCGTDDDFSRTHDAGDDSTDYCKIQASTLNGRGLVALANKSHADMCAKLEAMLRLSDNALLCLGEAIRTADYALPRASMTA